MRTADAAGILPRGRMERERSNKELPASQYIVWRACEGLQSQHLSVRSTQATIHCEELQTLVSVFVYIRTHDGYTYAARQEQGVTTYATRHLP